MKLSLAFTVALVLCPIGFVALASPQEPAKQEKPAPKPAVYDEKADATADVAAAVARAKKENKRVLVQWGGNWCGWCIKLHDTCKKDAKLARKLMYEYEVVNVDIGNFDKHLELVEKLGAPIKQGVPYLTILDADGKPIAQSETGHFEKDGAHDPKLLLEFFTQHEATPLVASAVREAALARAKAENKRVFLHFGAPWCGWCHRLEDWMAKPEIAAVLGKEFVDLKIDEDRMKGGKDMINAERTLAGVPEGGIPWFVMLDGDGKQLCHSNGPKGNTGFPSAEEEIAHFVTMLKSSCKVLSAQEIEFLAKDLVAEREKTERAAAERRKAAGK
jgi:thioredoxin-related protein